MKTAIYRHYDKDDRLLYLGISKEPFVRMHAHQQVATWVDDVARMTIEWVETRERAFELEKQYIIAELPLWNGTHNPRNAKPTKAKPQVQTKTAAPAKEKVKHFPISLWMSANDKAGLAALAKEQGRSMARQIMYMFQCEHHRIQEEERLGLTTDEERAAHWQKVELAYLEDKYSIGETL